MRKYIFYVPEENEPIGDVYYPDERDAPMPVEPLEMGRETCTDVGRYCFRCSVCDWCSNEPHHMFGGFWPEFCPNCGRRVVAGDAS